MQTTEYWDKSFSKGQGDDFCQDKMAANNVPVVLRALKHFGNIEKKTVIDLGCGRGAVSLYFARCGANVISVDLSGVAIKNLSKYCQDNGICNIIPKKMPAQELDVGQEKADFIFGSMILHHIEPFEEFARRLRDVIKPGGKGFFWENNAQSKIMIWFRQNIVGKLWVPKHGDPNEFPLTPSEVDEIRKYFHVEIEYPELFYFRMISLYLFRGHFIKPFQLLDNYFYKFSTFRKNSYRQYLFLS